MYKIKYSYEKPKVKEQQSLNEQSIAKCARFLLSHQDTSVILSSVMMTFSSSLILWGYIQMETCCNARLFFQYMLLGIWESLFQVSTMTKLKCGLRSEMTNDFLFLGMQVKTGLQSSSVKAKMNWRYISTSEWSHLYYKVLLMHYLDYSYTM